MGHFSENTRMASPSIFREHYPSLVIHLFKKKGFLKILLSEYNFTVCETLLALSLSSFSYDLSIFSYPVSIYNFDLFSLLHRCL